MNFLTIIARFAATRLTATNFAAIIILVVRQNASGFAMNNIRRISKRSKQMAKRKPVVIKTPYPTIEEVRKKLGLSKKKVKQIEKMMDEIFKKSKKRKKKS